MNIGALIRKLQLALLQKNIEMRINTKQFYSEKNNKMATKYSITTPQKVKKKIKNVTVYEGYSKIGVLKYLADTYKNVGGVNGGK